jgi:hypothetical protein
MHVAAWTLTNTPAEHERRVAPILMSVLIALAVTGMLGCRARSNPPPRPSTVPAAALWIGGEEGGVFALVEELTAAGRSDFHVRVWTETEGELLFDGTMSVVPPGGQPLRLSDPQQYDAWDGEALLLADGRRLIRVGN